MTDRRAYQREWQRNHPEKMKEYKRNSAIKAAIEHFNKVGWPVKKVEITQTDIDAMKRYLDWFNNAGWKYSKVKNDAVFCEEAIDMNVLRNMKWMTMSILERVENDVGGLL